MASTRSAPAVAVTGPTGTFGFGLIPLLQADARIGAITGIARRPFDPAAHGWTKMRYREGDVRDRAALDAAFAGADVVVHLAFNLTGRTDRDTIRAINVDGTMNAFAAAAAAGATRFVYASSVAAYGFDPGNPIGMTEEWPARPAEHLFYAQEKAEIERLLHEASAAHPEMDLYVLRPPIVLGPHTAGAKNLVPGPLEPVARRLASLALRLPVALPVPVAPLALQLIHEEDVGEALRLCVVGAGPPGVYNIAADGELTAVDLVREAGLRAIAVPQAPVQAAARLFAALPFGPPSVGWAEALASPVIMDTAKARRELGWRPRRTALEALRETLAAQRAG
ncbi:MAG TPA: NAD-dependent epimerase/dehydratase family protein [Solirubrobacteraceae bacterium]|nr:NAD-dependent epimerase/dehydratase family protein [Solirubrobacteraceae bacterium]